VNEDFRNMIAKVRSLLSYTPVTLCLYSGHTAVTLVLHCCDTDVTRILCFCYRATSKTFSNLVHF
jgi:hypothetical protein